MNAYTGNAFQLENFFLRETAEIYRVHKTQGIQQQNNIISTSLQEQDIFHMQQGLKN